MKNNLTNYFEVILISTITLLVSQNAAAKFAYEGHLSDTADNPLVGQAALIRVSILPPSGSCVLFQEAHSVTTNNKGFFAVQIGSGTNSYMPAASPFNSLDGVFLNNGSIITGASSCTYVTVVGESRRMQIEVSTNAGATYENLGTIALGKSPQASHAETVGGFTAAELVKVAPGATAPTYSSSDITNLSQLINGTSTLYVASANNGVINVTASAPLSSTGGPTPNITIAQANSTTAGYLTSSDWSTFNSKLGAISPFSGDITGNIGSTSISKIQGIPITATGPANGSVLKYNGSQYMPSAPLGLPAYANFGTTAGTVAAGDDSRFSMLKALSGTQAFPSFSFSSDTSTGIFNPGVNTLAISTSGSEKLRVTAAGDVGIGTIAPTAKLDINGDLKVGNAITSGTSIQNMRICSGSNGAFPTITNTTAVSFNITCTGLTIGSAVMCSPDTNFTHTISWMARVYLSDTITVSLSNTNASNSAPAANWTCLVAN